MSLNLLVPFLQLPSFVSSVDNEPTNSELSFTLFFLAKVIQFLGAFNGFPSVVDRTCNFGIGFLLGCLLWFSLIGGYVTISCMCF